MKKYLLFTLLFAIVSISVFAQNAYELDYKTESGYNIHFDNKVGIFVDEYFLKKTSDKFYDVTDASIVIEYAYSELKVKYDITAASFSKEKSLEFINSFDLDFSNCIIQEDVRSKVINTRTVLYLTYHLPNGTISSSYRIMYFQSPIEHTRYEITIPTHKDTIIYYKDDENCNGRYRKNDWLPDYYYYYYVLEEYDEIINWSMPNELRNTEFSKYKREHNDRDITIENMRKATGISK